MAFAPILQNVAVKLIKQFGRTVTLTTVSSGDYNADTGESSTTSTSTITVFLDTYKTNDFKPGLVELGDVPIYTVSTIDKDDKITIDSIVYSVTHVSKYHIEASIVLYVANLRRL